MAKKLHMTWVAGSRRWRKLYKGKWYAVSCRQLNCEDTKEASWRLANDWWEREQGIADTAPPSEEERQSNALKVWAMVEDWKQLDEQSRAKLVDTLLGTGQFDRLKQQAAAVAETLDPVRPDRTVKSHVSEWTTFLRSICQAGQMSEGRYDAYVRNIAVFQVWAGPESAVDTIDEAKLEAYFTHLSLQVAAEKYSPSYAHTLMMTAKQFISRLAEQNLINLPGNIRSRRLRFNHSAPAKIETFTVEEIKALLNACDGFSPKTKLYVLLMLNCGMYQNDIAELHRDEVNWTAGTVTRSRSKTRERQAPVVTYKLWPETFALLKAHRARHGDLALTTDEGKPLVRYWIEGEKMRRYDVIQSAWTRLAEKMDLTRIRLSMKHLRKTSASLLGQHAHYKFYANHFLADSPRTVADRHYVTPSNEEFFQALAWLRTQILG